MKDLKLAKVANGAKINWLEAKTLKQGHTIKHWNERAPHITHCLKAFQILLQYVLDVTSMMRTWLTGLRSLHEARWTLIGLNQDVSSIDQALDFMARPSNHATAQQQESGIRSASNGSNTIALSENHGQSQLAESSAADLKALSRQSPAAEALYALSKSTRIVQTPQVQETSAEKRKRIDSANDAVYNQRDIPEGSAYQRGESRIAMPPPTKVPSVVSNVHAYAGPRHRGHIHPTNPFYQLDVHAENTVMAPGLPYYVPQNNILTGAQSQGLETGGDPRLPAVYDRHPTMGSNDQHGQYYNTGRSGAETFYVSPDEQRRVDGFYQFPEPRFEQQRAPSTATLNRSYLPQQPRFDQRAASRAISNRSYQPQQSSFDQRTPSTATPNRSYLSQQSSLSDRRTTTATKTNTPFRAPTPRPLHPTSYRTNPHPTPSTQHRTHPLNDGELDHHHPRRLTLPQTPTLARTGLLPHARTSTTPRQPLGPHPLSAQASPFFASEPRASTANPHLLNGLSFMMDPSTAAAREGYSAEGRMRNVQR